MTIRRLALMAVLATAAVAAPTTSASAQTYGGVTLSFGSGGYGGYDDDDDRYAPGGYDAYAGSRYYRDYDRSYAWRERQRSEQIERWREEQHRRQHWAHERREHRQWRDRDDDDD